MPRRVIANQERTLVDAAFLARDPERGASRREGFLLAAFAILFVAGVWTVAVSELAPQEPGSLHPNNVTAPTQQPEPPGK